ncbi:MAG: DEAD/DEAH box helicase [Candidatus Omnitrophota bacterium]
MKGITEAGFTTLMPVQEEALIYTLEGRDAYVQSQTGTGKTAAFMITIFQLFLREDSPIKRKQALIIAPTRELAIQIDHDAQLLGKYLNFTIGCFYGGVGYDAQEKSLANNVDIIIGTPGRLLDFQQKGKMDFSTIGILVIDEADRLFDMGFLPDIRRIVDSMPRRNKRLTMLFSATMDERTKAITREYMKNPALIEIMPEQVTVERVTQELYHVAEQEKMSVMLGILKKENPRNVLIFTNMKHTAEKVAKKLEHNGFKSQFISGDLPQAKRLRVISNFKEGKLAVLVATDVAARGLHIENLELIINYDLPQDCENYVHRIGRTARAGKSGKAISLVCENYVYNLEAIEQYIGMKIPVMEMDEGLFQEDKTAHMNFDRPKRRKGTIPRLHDSKGREKRERTKKNSGKTEEDVNYNDNLKKEKVRKEKDYKKERTNFKEQTPRKGKDNSTKTVNKQDKPLTEKKGKYQPPERRGERKPHEKNNVAYPRKTKSMEDRLEYYKKKYGDNFRVNDGATTAAPFSPTAPTETDSKTSLFKKILGFFLKKNN